MKMILIIIALCISLSISHPSIDETQQTQIDLSFINKPLQELLLTFKQTQNPEELGSYFEGDMLIPEVESRNGMLQARLRWPNNIVPYVFAPSVGSTERQHIRRAMSVYQSQTCIKFVPRTNEADFVSFENTATGCWSYVGRIGGMQKLNLQSPGCTGRIGTALHEIMHALGFLHEQSRFDRDSHVRVSYQNIIPEQMHNFNKAQEGRTTDFGVPYDISSIMHYSSTAFSSNGQRTIESLMSESVTRRMGQREGLSKSDLIKINAMYCKK